MSQNVNYWKYDTWNFSLVSEKFLLSIRLKRQIISGTARITRNELIKPQPINTTRRRRQLWRSTRQPSNRPTNLEEIDRTIEAMRNNKAPDYENIHSELYKLEGTYIKNTKRTINKCAEATNYVWGRETKHNMFNLQNMV